MWCTDRSKLIISRHVKFDESHVLCKRKQEIAANEQVDRDELAAEVESFDTQAEGYVPAEVEPTIDDEERGHTPLPRTILVIDLGDKFVHLKDTVMIQKMLHMLSLLMMESHPASQKR